METPTNVAGAVQGTGTAIEQTPAETARIEATETAETTGQEIGTGREKEKGHEMDIERGVTIEVGITTKTRAAPVVAAGQDRVVLR